MTFHRVTKKLAREEVAEQRAKDQKRTPSPNGGQYAAPAGVERSGVASLLENANVGLPREGNHPCHLGSDEHAMQPTQLLSGVAVVGHGVPLRWQRREGLIYLPRTATAPISFHRVDHGNP